MNRIYYIICLLTLPSLVWAQPTFKCGWNTYKTNMVIHEYTYSFVLKDSVKLYLEDSAKYFVAPDSAAVLKVGYPMRDNITFKEANWFNIKKKLTKKEEYKGNELMSVAEYKYDDKFRKIMQTEENKVTSSNYKKVYDYSIEKATGNTIISEVSYFNGRVEFYTKTYYDNASHKIKEVRLNDNNKDIVHVEDFIYGANGKVKQRSVFFPEFKVTKKFDELGGDDPIKCFRAQPLVTTEKVMNNNKISFLKRFLHKNAPLLLDKDCHTYEYKFQNTTVEIVISTVPVNNIKQVIIRIKE